MYTFIREDLKRTNPKFVVRDENGVEWKVKLGPEAKPETAASRLSICADGGWNRIHLLQFDGVIFQPGIRNDFVTCRHSLKGDAICAGLQARSWKINFNFGTPICRIESRHHVAHVVVEPGMKIERAQTAVGPHTQSGDAGMLYQQ